MREIGAENTRGSVDLSEMSEDRSFFFHFPPRENVKRSRLNFPALLVRSLSPSTFAILAGGLCHIHTEAPLLRAR
jgi:hypothetical protein